MGKFGGGGGTLRRERDAQAVQIRQLQVALAAATGNDPPAPAAVDRPSPVADDAVFFFHHRVICYGDSHARRLALRSRPTALSFGRLVVGTQARYHAQSGLGANPQADGRWLHAAVVRGAAERWRPAAAVISYGGAALLGGGGRDGRTMIPSEERAPAMAACVKAVELAVGVVALDKAAIPIVLGTIPPPSLSSDELAEFRQTCSWIPKMDPKI